MPVSVSVSVSVSESAPESGSCNLEGRSAGASWEIGEVLPSSVIPSEAPKGPTRDLVNLEVRQSRTGSNCVDDRSLSDSLNGQRINR